MLTRDNILLSLTDIDDAYILESENVTSRTRFRPRHRRRLFMAATTLAAIIFLAYIGLSILRDDTGIVISQYDDSIKNTSYPYPAPGEMIFEMPVTDARLHFKGKPVHFLLGFKFYEEDNSFPKESDMALEYRRLTKAGYDLYQTEVWDFENGKDKRTMPVVVGLFTEEELKNFNANEKYGYHFYFVTNGDNSPLTFTDATMTSLSP